MPALHRISYIKAYRSIDECAMTFVGFPNWMRILCDASAVLRCFGQLRTCPLLRNAEEGPTTCFEEQFVFLTVAQFVFVDDFVFWFLVTVYQQHL